MDSSHIPDKTYFKIGEVARFLDLEAYVLRYWETEFEVLDPEKTKTGQRAYRREDIELLLLIKTLLYDEMYTIAGARRQIKLRKRGEIEPLGPEAQHQLVQRHDALVLERDAWTKEREAWVKERETWTKERERLSSAAETHQDEVARLRVHNHTLENENAQLASAQIDFESSIKRLGDEVAQRRLEVAELQQRLDESTGSPSEADREALAQALAEREEQVAVIASLQATLADAEAELAAATADVATLNTQVETSQAALDAATAQLAASSAELARLAEENEGLEADLASAESELERLESQRAALAAQAADTSALEELQHQLQHTHAALASLRAEHQSLLQTRKDAGDRQTSHVHLLRRELQSLAALVN